MIEIKNMSYTYPNGHKALTDINLTIPDGQIAAVIGHTGSGKSTLVQTLNGLIRPTVGHIIIDGEDIAPLKTKDVCKKAGLVFQYPEKQLFEETVREDIAFGPRNLGLDETAVKKRVLSAADMVGLSEESLGKSPFELSGGEMRRAAIAGVIAMQPKILILDEPTAGLDPRGTAMVLDMIKRLRCSGMTVIFVTHSMEDAAEISERVIVMNKGRVELDGTVGGVFSEARRLRKIGLDVPIVTSVMRELRAMGYGVSDEIYTARSAAEEIKRCLKI